MKRDMDLIRDLLLEIESNENDEEINFEDRDKATVIYHLNLLKEIGYIDDFSEDILGSLYAGQLTWEGNDYLDKIRDNSVWKKTKDVISQKGLPLVFDTIKTISSAFITAAAEGVTNSIIKNGGQQ